MVKLDVVARGINLAGVAQSKPVLLQMDHEDFPNAFLRDLGALGQSPLSSTQALPAAPAAPVTLYQPVTRVVHLAMVELHCESLGFPRLCPLRVDSAGLVIRRVPRTNGVNDLSKPPSAVWNWMKDANGRFAWVKRDPSHQDDDPDPARRPRIQSGQEALDRMLALQTMSSALMEVTTPAFVAAPDVCSAAQRTLVYAVVPTASSEASSQPAPPPRYDPRKLADSLPTLLKAGSHASPLADKPVHYEFMSDDYVRAKSAGDFIVFSTALRMMYTVFGAFEKTPEAEDLLNILNQRYVTVANGSGFRQQRMGEFYRQAAGVLMDYDPATKPVPSLVMPRAWEFLSDSDQKRIVGAVTTLLQKRSAKTLTPEGRFQDATRLYRLRLFFRIKSKDPDCPGRLVWSEYSDPFRIAAWYESSGRVVPAVPLPDPTDRNFLKSAKPNASFAVPAGLMNAMNGATLDGLSKGSAGGGGGGISLNWICGFNIPLITICAFFVLNIFLLLLNIVFFWLPFIKICIPFPISQPGANSGED